MKKLILCFLTRFFHIFLISLLCIPLAVRASSFKIEKPQEPEMPNDPDTQRLYFAAQYSALKLGALRFNRHDIGTLNMYHTYINAHLKQLTASNNWCLKPTKCDLMLKNIQGHMCIGQEFLQGKYISNHKYLPAQLRREEEKNVQERINTFNAYRVQFIKYYDDLAAQKN